MEYFYFTDHCDTVFRFSKETGIGVCLYRDRESEASCFNLKAWKSDGLVSRITEEVANKILGRDNWTPFNAARQQADADLNELLERRELHELTCAVTMGFVFACTTRQSDESEMLAAAEKVCDFAELVHDIRKLRRNAPTHSEPITDAAKVTPDQVNEWNERR